MVDPNDDIPERWQRLLATKANPWWPFLGDAMASETWDAIISIIKIQDAKANGRKY